MFELDALLLIVLLILVALLLLGRRLYRLGKTPVSAVVADVRTRMLPPGPRRDAAILRSRLDAELRSTRDMLREAPRGLVFRADAASLVADVDATAASLLRELAAIERFRDSAQQRSALAAVRLQAEQLIETTYLARQTLLQTSAADRAGELSRLRARVDQQVAALEVYRRDGGQLSL